MAIAVASVVSRAEAAPRTPAAEARAHYKKGMRAYDLGRFDEAIREFEAAYELNDDAAYLFNLAQAHRRAGNSQKSLELYRTYLRKVPEASDREMVERQIAALEKELAATAAQAATVTPPPAQPAVGAGPSARAGSPEIGSGPLVGASGDPARTSTGPEPGGARDLPPRDGDAGAGRTLKIAGLSAGIGGLLLAGVGAVFAVQASDKADQVANAPTFDPGLDDEAHSLRTRSYVFFAIGGAVFATGVVLVALGFNADSDDAGHGRRTTAGVFPQIGAGEVGLSYLRSF